MRSIFLALAAYGTAAPLLTQAAVPAPSELQQPALVSPTASPTVDDLISADEARQTALDFATVLEENYLFPDVAKKYAQRLRSGADKGEYDRVGTPSALAVVLTDQMQAIYPDGHLRIWPDDELDGPQPMMMLQAQQGPVKPAKSGPGEPIEEARWLAPGVAYIRFTIFPPNPAVTAAAAKFMSDHADAKALIFDARTLRGGGMGQAAAMLPYLFDKETVFVSQDTRTSVAQRAGVQNMPPWMRPASSTKEGIFTTEIFVQPHPSERRLFDAKVFVLTSNETVSAGEAFALGMKATGRATLIGQTTTGAGHYAPPGQRVNDKFRAFVPVGRGYDPRTGKGWEGTGVAPDIEVPAEKALVEALVRSGIPPKAAERLSASVDPYR